MIIESEKGLLIQVHLGYYRIGVVCITCRSDKPSYMEYVDNEHYGYTRLVANATTLAMEFIRNEDGSQGDAFTLIKK